MYAWALQLEQLCHLIRTELYAICAKNWQCLVTITTNIYLTYITGIIASVYNSNALSPLFFPLMLDAQCKKPDLIMDINHLVTMQFAVISLAAMLRELC